MNRSDANAAARMMVIVVTVVPLALLIGDMAARLNVPVMA